MTKPFGHSRTEFYLTAPAPCPYLPHQKERKVFSFLPGPNAKKLNAALSYRGFRRSQNIAYMPACDSCTACTPIRIVVDGFAETPSRRRTYRRNHDIQRQINPPIATRSQFSVMSSYLNSRHGDGDMADMTILDYTAMVEQTDVDTVLIEYWANIGTPSAQLVACALTDRLPEGLSMVYSFFVPDQQKRSLGSHMILDHVLYARELGLPYIYLGYWVKGAPKMDYKTKFQPLECLTSNGWESFPSPEA